MDYGSFNNAADYGIYNYFFGSSGMEAVLISSITSGFVLTLNGTDNLPYHTWSFLRQVCLSFSFGFQKLESK